MTADWPPSGILLRSWSAYLLAQYPLEDIPVPEGDPEPGVLVFTPIDPPPGYDPATDPMKPMIDVALALLSGWTCRNFQTGADIPDSLAQVALLATVLTVEQLTFAMTPEQRAAAMASTASGNLRSFTAGPYSESYFGPDEIKYAWNLIVPDPLLNSMLMALITPECLANRIALAEGTYPPGYATQEIDWTWPPGYASGRAYDRGGDWLP